MGAVRQRLSPEFINRIDEIVMFNKLGRNVMGDIVSVQLRQVSRVMEEKGITLEVSPAAHAWLAEQGYDFAYGARPLVRSPLPADSGLCEVVGSHRACVW